MVFAHIFHHSIPGLAHPIANKVRDECCAGDERKELRREKAHNI
jgi:hypothetical protein